MHLLSILIVAASSATEAVQLPIAVKTPTPHKYQVSSTGPWFELKVYGKEYRLPNGGSPIEFRGYPSPQVVQVRYPEESRTQYVEHLKREFDRSIAADLARILLICAGEGYAKEEILNRIDEQLQAAASKLFEHVPSPCLKKVEQSVFRIESEHRRLLKNTEWQGALQEKYRHWTPYTLQPYSLQPKSEKPNPSPKRGGLGTIELWAGVGVGSASGVSIAAEASVWLGARQVGDSNLVFLPQVELGYGARLLPLTDRGGSGRVLARQATLGGSLRLYPSPVLFFDVGAKSTIIQYGNFFPGDDSIEELSIGYEDLDRRWTLGHKSALAGLARIGFPIIPFGESSMRPDVKRPVWTSVEGTFGAAPLLFNTESDAQSRLRDPGWSAIIRLGVAI